MPYLKVDRFRHGYKSNISMISKIVHNLTNINVGKCVSMESIFNTYENNCGKIGTMKAPIDQL